MGIAGTTIRQDPTPVAIRASVVVTHASVGDGMKVGARGGAGPSRRLAMARRRRPVRRRVLMVAQR